MAMIDIGGIKEESIQYRVEAITAIMNHIAGDSVKVAALQALSTMLQIGNTTISDCSFTGDTSASYTSK